MEKKELNEFKKALQENYNNTPDHLLKGYNHPVLVGSEFFKILKETNPELIKYVEITPSLTPKIKTNR